MKKILKYTISPLMSTYNYSAGAMSIIEACSLKMPHCVVNEFTTISYRLFWNQLDFKLRNLKKWQCLEIVKKRKSNYTDFIIAFVKESIDKDFYLYLFVNEFYLPFRWSYKKQYALHDLYLIGYDDELGGVYTLAYDKNHKYNINFVDYIDMKNAIKTTKYKKSISMLKYSLQDNNLCANKIVYNLTKYRRNMRLNYFILKMKIVFAHKNKRTIDIISFKIFFEHKKILNKLAENYSFEGINNLLIKSNILYLLVLKYNMCQSNKNYNKLILLLNETRRLESIFFEKIKRWTNINEIDN